MAEKYIKPVDWQWTQGTYGFSVIFSLKDKEHLSSIDVDNYDFVVNVQRGESPKNTYTADCTVIDVDSKKIEYVVGENDLTRGDEFYYIELQAYHKDPDLADSYNEERKISSQEVLKIFVRRKKDNSV